MGLDQYLFRRRRADEFEQYDEELAYWRKAYMVKQWFVDNTGYDIHANCEKHEVSKEQLQKLLETCETVLERPSLAKLLLPTSAESFFGTMEYNEWYFDDLRLTVEQLTRVLREVNFDTDTVYYYEWW